jgi:hypothetical protein
MKTILTGVIAGVNPKNLAPAIKKNKCLHEWVNTFPGGTIAEKVFNILTPGQDVCSYGNKKKFASLTLGYKFCGRAGQCQCAKEAVSEKVSIAKKNYSVAQKEVIAKKRKATTLEKYGVENVGQTDFAKQRHAKVYQDTNTVSQVVSKVKETKLNRYQNPNYNNSDKIKNTFRKKRTDGYWIDKYPNKNITVLENKDSLLSLFTSMGVVEIADSLNVHIQTVYKYLNYHKIREPFKSTDELEIERYLHSIGVTNIVRNSRKILDSGKELDFFLPDFNIAIEYNGVYWHHEDVSHISRDYHWRKFKECEDKGIRLITIFSNFWHSKKDIVKKLILNKLNLATDAIYARKCKIITLQSANTKQFLEDNHVQGYTPAQIVYGLTYNDLLVAVMSFSKSRLAIGNKTSDTELVRFASSTRVIGAASKLLAYFKKMHPAESIMSYSNNEWSDGNVYKQLGFALTAEVPPSYWYLKPREHKLYHRYTFNKQKLLKQGYDQSKTESQITKEMGLLKVWDCGKKKWVLDNY